MNNQKREQIINIPNFLSISRILLTPVFLYLILIRNNTCALIIFLIAASTDMLDGMAARLLNQKTKLGALLDPAGDKTLMTAAFIILSFPSLGFLNSLPIWLTFAVIGRDIYLIIGALILFKLIGQKSFHPSLLGKICTFTQMTVILLVLFFNALPSQPGLLNWLYLVTFILTVLSGLQYTYIGINWYKEYKDR